MPGVITRHTVLGKYFLSDELKHYVISRSAFPQPRSERLICQDLRDRRLANVALVFKP